MTTTKADVWPTYSAPNGSGWRTLLPPVDIDSLPATPETVGMPRVGGVMRCVPCDFAEVIRRDMIDDDGAVMCRW